MTDPQLYTKDQIKNTVLGNLKTLYRKTVATASDAQIYNAVAMAVKEVVSANWIATHDYIQKTDTKTVYYLSMEFLMGRFMGNAMLNLALEGTVKEALDELGVDINRAEEFEPDPGLGNGGLGRLAACFLDSLSTLGYPAYGCGIRYHYGIFEQHIDDGYQVEKPDNWLKGGDPWGVRQEDRAVQVDFGGRVVSFVGEDGTYRFKLEDCQSVMAVPYDYPVVGYATKMVNTLRLWDAEAINRFDLQFFNGGQYERAVEENNLARKLSSVLYPADEHVLGKELRLRQQYFFISATIQSVLAKFAARHGHGGDFSKLADYVQFQLNDTHPSLAVAELMRVLVDIYCVPWAKAWDITQATCAYTNHTIMSEALEKWPVELFSRLLPRIYLITEEINRRFCKNLIEWYGNDPERIRKMAICADGQIRMAHLAIVGSHSVNGVAAIHTEILKNHELKDFYEIFPEKFNNKTNGITPRRWLAYCNKGLSSLITNNIGDGWITNLQELKKLAPLATDSSFAQKFMEVKHQNKVNLSNYIMQEYGLRVDPASIFDIQVKRLHEYKRQLLNIFQIIDLYNSIKLNPGLNIAPRTFIFSAKAAASYHRAKLIIKLINTVAQVVNNDATVAGRIKVVFLPNYRVSLAEKLVPACDVSQQISTAGKEASGTGNMKFMLNGALTIGTLDGANVEMLEEVGADNMFIFGMTADQVHALTTAGNYSPWDIYNMEFDVRNVLTTLINGSLDPNMELFRELYDAMLNGYGGARPDEYYVLKDFAHYKATQAKVDEAYKDASRWARMAINNVACAGKFSSDRTISQYATEIWDIKPIKVN